MCTFEVLVQNKRSSNPSWKIRFEIKSYAELNHNINNSFTGYLRQSGQWSLCFLFRLDATMKMPISYQNSGKKNGKLYKWMLFGHLQWPLSELE